MKYRKPDCTFALVLMALPLLAQAEAQIYGNVHVSLDYVDADADASWFRPAPGGPSFDFQGFVDAANQVLADSGYTAYRHKLRVPHVDSQRSSLTFCI